MAMDTAEVTENANAAASGPVYVTYKEAREGSSGHHHHGHGRDSKHRTVNFYLVDKDDNAVLAVEGEDQGDAHYNYHNVDEFDQYGTIQVHTRKEVIEWLEMIIHETQLKSKGSESSLHEQTPLDENGLYYTRHEQRRDHMPDGRRVNKWLLFDQHEAGHLAVQGQERDARDGHYTYSAVEPFASRSPMPPCTNQQQVMHWLEQFISHNAPKSAMHVGDHIRTGHSHGSGTPRRSRSPRSVHRRDSPPAEGVTRRSKRARVATDPGLRSGASSPTASPPETKAASPPAPSPISHVTLTAALKKTQDSEPPKAPSKGTKKAPAKAAKAGATPAAAAAGKGSGRLGGAAEASQARRVKAIQAAAKLQVTALEQAARSELQSRLRAAGSQQDASRSAALQWSTHPTPANDVAHVEAYLPVISAALAAEGIQLSEEARRALTGLEAAPPPPHPRAARLELLEALREVTTVYCAADVLAQRHVVEVVTACLQFPCPAVQQIAQHALRQWRRVALVHLRVLTDPMAAIEPQQAYQDAEEAGRLSVPVPQHLQDALEGLVPPAKAAPAPTPTMTAQKLPNQSPTKNPLSQVEPVGPVLSQRSLSFGATCTAMHSPAGTAITPVLGGGAGAATPAAAAGGSATTLAMPAGGQTILSTREVTPAPLGAGADAPGDATPAPTAATTTAVCKGGDPSTAAAALADAAAVASPVLVSQSSVAFELGRQASDGLPETPLQVGASKHRRDTPQPAAPAPQTDMQPAAAGADVAQRALSVPRSAGDALPSQEPPLTPPAAASGSGGATAAAPAASATAAGDALAAHAGPDTRATDTAEPTPPHAASATSAPATAGNTATTPRATDTGRRRGSQGLPSDVRTPAQLRDSSSQGAGGPGVWRGSAGSGSLSMLEKQTSGGVNVNSAHVLARSDPVRTTPGRTMPLQTLNEPARARQVLGGDRGGTGAAPHRQDGGAGARTWGGRSGGRDATNGAKQARRSVSPPALTAAPLPPPERQSSLQALRQQHGMHSAAADAMHAHMRGRDVTRDSQQLPLPWDDTPSVHADDQRRGGGGSGAMRPMGAYGGSHRPLPCHVLALNDIFADQPPSGPGPGPGPAAEQRTAWHIGGGGLRGPLRSNMDSSLSTRFPGSVTQWGSEAEEAAAVARLPAPPIVTLTSVVKLVVSLRDELPRLPQRAVAPLCARVHDATRRLLTSLALSDKQGEMAREQVTACAEALKSNAAQLAAGMAAAERHRILEHVHEFARDLIMQLNVLGLAVPPGAPP